MSPDKNEKTDKAGKTPEPDPDLIKDLAIDFNPVGMLLGLSEEVLQNFKDLAIVYNLPKLRAFFEALPGVQKEMDNAPNQDEFMPVIQKIFMKIIKEGTGSLSLFPSMDEVMDAFKKEEKPKDADGSDSP